MAEVVKLKLDRPALNAADRRALHSALDYGPDYRRAWVRVQEARGLISEAGAERVIRVLEPGRAR